MRIVVAICVWVWAIGAALATPSSNDRTKAKALYESGTAHYNLNEYAEALKDFKEAYRLVQNPSLLFNLAQCYRQLKEYEEAAKLLKTFRREFPDAPNREDVDKLIIKLEELIAEKNAPTPAPSPPPPVVETQPPPPPASPPESTATASITVPPPQKKRVKPWVLGVVGGVVGVVVVGGIAAGVVIGTRHSLPPKLPDVRF